jgi:hypothetical protein
MSEKDWNARLVNNKKIRRGEKPEPLKEVKLTIQILESTVTELRELSWDIDGNNVLSYDGLILWLLDFYRKHQRGQREKE